MKSKFSIKTTIAIVLLAILCCVAIGGIVGWDSYRTYADDGVYYTLESVNVSLKPGWMITTRTQDNMLYKMLSVDVTYSDASGKNETKTLSLESDGKAITGEQVTFANNQRDTITVTVQPVDNANYNQTPKSGTLTYTLGDSSQAVVKDITATFTAPDSSTFVINTATVLWDDNFLNCIKVNAVESDGYVNNNSLSFMVTTTDLFPTSLTQEILEGATYDKNVTVSSNGMTTTVLITGIKFIAPSAVLRMAGNLGSMPTARSKNIDISKLTVTLEYGDEWYTIPATAFPVGWFTYEYTTAEGKKVNELGIDVKNIKVTFTYPDLDSVSRSFSGITVSRLEVDAPRVDPTPIGSVVNLTWNDGASIDLTGWNYADLYEEDPPAPEITIYAVSESDSSRSPIESEDLVSFNDVTKVKTVKFPHSGQYVVAVTLPEKGDFAWGTVYDGIKSADGMTVEYTVVVDKGTPEVTLAGIDNVKYGTANSNGTLSAKLDGEDMTSWSWGYESKDLASTHLGDFEFHYHLEYYTAYTSEDDNTPATDLRSDGKPKNVGTYYVVAVTHENAGYYKVTSDAVEFEITPFEISVATTGNDRVYQRGVYSSIEDFLTFSPSLPHDSVNYTETIYDVLAITDNTVGSDTKGTVTVATKYTHANQYSINVAVDSTGAYSNNYVLANSSTNSVDLSFSITTYTGSTFDFTASGWAYGATNANPNESVTSWGINYYPSNTGNVASDFTITYYHYDSTKPNNAGTEVSELDFIKWAVGKYVVKLVANAASNGLDETAAEEAGDTVDYTLPVKYFEIEVTSASVKAPWLGDNWVQGNDKASATQAVYTYSDTNLSGLSVALQDWIDNNIAADGSYIITVSVTYITIVTNGQSIIVDSSDGLFDGTFGVNKAGYYIVTITLNPNYSWDSGSTGYQYASQPSYSFIGFVARQQIDISTLIVSGDTDTYNGSAQDKTVNGWNANALKISDVTGVIIGGATAIGSGISKPSDESNVFSVTNAGVYTVKIDITDKDNYEWLGSTDLLSTIERTYTLNQAQLKVKWTGDLAGTIDEGGDYPRFEFNGTKSSQLTPTATASVDFSADNSNLGNFTYTLYSDSDFSKTLEAVTAIGHFYIAVTSFGGTAASNYRLSDTQTDIGTIFEIYSFGLKAPEYEPGTAFNGSQVITEIYSGKVFDVTKYIVNYPDYFIGDAYRIKVEVFKGESLTSALNADTYIVKISISDDNFKWADEGADTYTFTLIIDQRTVKIAWGIDYTTYNPNGNAAPTYTINNRVNNDPMTLQLEYKLNGQGNALNSLTNANAGVYTVYAVKLVGDDDVIKNYKIVPDQSNDVATYTIRKQSVAKPTLPSGEVNGFDGVSGFEEIEFATYYNTANVTIKITGVVPSGWFMLFDKKQTATDLSIGDVITLNFSEGQKATFTYTRAGVYSFEVSLDATNYYWDGDGQGEYGATGQYTYTVENGFTVNRKEIVAPDIKPYRAQEFNNLAGKPDFETEDIALYDITYYTVVPNGADTSSSTMPGFKDDKEGILGTYYAKLVIKNSLEILNYVWEFNTNDPNNGTGYLSGYADDRYYTDGEVSIIIYYTITRGQLDIELVVQNYVFGDNGYVNGEQGHASFEPDKALSTDTSKIVYLVGKNVDVVTTVETKVQEGTLVFKDSQGNKLDPEKDLVNGLPWNAGAYSLEFELLFGNGETYANKTVSGSFTVAKRDIAVTWDEETEFTYNATEQIITATISTVVKKSLTDTDDYTAGLTLVVELDSVGGKPKNAGSYKVIVTDIDVDVEGDTICNFKLPDVNNLTTTFEIKPQDVTVKGVEVDNHVYGDDITANEKKFDAQGFIPNDSCADDAKNAIRVLICEETNGTEQIGKYAKVGTYYVVVGWDNDYDTETAIYKKNYNVHFDCSATFEIVKREITVEWDNSASSVYGSAVDLYKHLKITSCNSVDELDKPLAGLDIAKVITLVATLEDVEELGTQSIVGQYTITPSMYDDVNWAITFTDGESWVYNVTNATILDEDNSLKAQELTYNAQNQNVFANPHVSVVNSTLNPAKWQYALVESADVEASDSLDWQAMTGNNISLYTAGTYYFVIKITADNHNDFIKKVTVVIAKAKLEVQLNFNIMYGEEDPAGKEHLFDTHRTGGGAWKITGFMGSDESKFYSSDSFYRLDGQAHYAIDGYEKGDFEHIARKNYTIVYVKGSDSLFTLQCDNYEFVLKEGVLTVDKVAITVTAIKQIVSYNGEVPAISSDTVGYTVTHPYSTYDSNVLYNTYYYADYIEVTSSAFTDPNPNSTTAGVGLYELMFKLLECDYYDITVANNTETEGKYSVADMVQIVAAELDVEDIYDYNKPFDEQYHGLLVGDDRVDSVNPDVVFATASDHTSITIKFYLVDDDYSEIELNARVLEGRTPLAGVPTYIDRDTYHIVYVISAGDNYQVVYGYNKIVISIAENVLSEDFAYTVGDENKVEKDSDLNNAKDAWTYGYDVVDGFYYSNVTNPVSTYTRASATKTVALQYQLTYYSDVNADGSEIASGQFTGNIFEAVFNAGNLNAGYYKLRVYMNLDETDNFSFNDVYYVFKVAKRTFTVSWNNGASTVYGNDVELYQYLTVTAYVGTQSNFESNALAGKQFADVIKLVATLNDEEETLSKISNVGEYTITPSMIDAVNWAITFTDGESWVYNVTNATIVDEDNSLKAQELTYNAEYQNVFANPHVSVVNSELNLAKWQYALVESADVEASDSLDWKTMTDNNISLYTAGTYYFVIKITADNHNDFIKKVTVVIVKAKLDVQLNFSIMYGEDDPTEHDYLFDTHRNSGSKWNITGFINDSERNLFYSEDGFYNLKGNAFYAIDNYVKGDFSSFVPSYTIMYSDELFTLVCDNYEFVLTNGTLTIEKIAITLTAKSQVVSYNGDISSVRTEAKCYSVTHPDSTYGGGKHATDAYSKYISVSSPAFDNPNPNSTTAKVGSYALIFTLTNSEYYTIEVDKSTGSGNQYSVANMVEIVATTLDVSTIESYNELFDQQYHGLIVDGSDSAQTKVTFATASDGTVVKVEFYRVYSDYSDVVLSESHLSGLTALADMPSYIDCDTYRIVYKISAGENYIPVYRYNEIVIRQVTNELTQQFTYTVDSENKVVNSNDVNVAEIAWTYGYEVTDGFYYSNVKNPVPKFTRANAGDGEGKYVSLLYQLTYHSDVEAVGNLIASGEFTGNIFKAIFEEGNFNAGYYHLRVYMELGNTDNFTFTAVNYVFRVAKRNLNITAEDTSTIYGENAPEFKHVYTGLVPSGILDKGTDSITDAIGDVPTFVTEYSIGKAVGGGENDDQGRYRIYVDDKLFDSTNYVVSYSDAWLTVNKREISITINDKTSTYNKDVYELTFEIASGSKDIYTSELVPNCNYDSYDNSNQKLLILKTDAIVNGITNDVKYLGDPQDHGKIIGYTIYVVFYSDAVANNYTIKFVACTHKETDDTEAIGYDGSVNNAGTYLIEQASFEIVQKDVNHIVKEDGQDKEIQTRVYSGAVNYYKAYFDNAEQTPISFTYERKVSEGVYESIDASQVVEVGTYRAKASSTNPNYTAGTFSAEFTITVATLTLTADAKKVQYGTKLTGDAATDKTSGIVKDDGTGRFEGFTYTASSKHLIDSIVEEYQSNTVKGEYITYSVGSYSPTTAVGTHNLTITPVCQGNRNNPNIDIDYVSDTLEVVARKVTVTIVGDEGGNEFAWCYYQGKNELLQNKLNSLYVANYASYIKTDFEQTFGDAFTQDEADEAYKALCIVLTFFQDANASDVGTYYIQYAIDTTKASNFDVTFTNKNTGAVQPEFRVERAKLTLYAYDTGYSNEYSVVYGDSIELEVPRSAYVTTDGKLRYSVSGMVDGQYFTNILGEKDLNVKFSVMCASKVYAPWDSTTSESYVVAIVEFDSDAFTNYVVETYISADLKVIQRVISASTANQVFGFDGNNFNGGLYGKMHEAEITFADSASNKEVDSTKYRPVGYTLSYTTQDLFNGSNKYQTAGMAPTVAGKYTVTVTIVSDGNYVFSGGSYSFDLSFEVTKLNVSTADLTWSKASIDRESSTSDVLKNSIDNFQEGYMMIANFVYAPSTGAAASDVKLGDATQRGTYYYDAVGALQITIDKAAALGNYTARIELKDAAKNNVELVFNYSAVDFVNVSFDVTATSVEMTIEFDDFIYGEKPGILTVKIDGSETSANITVNYALLTYSEKVLELYNGHQTYGNEQIKDLERGGMSIAPNFVAGYYLLFVHYSGTPAQDGYYIFKVEKKTIDVPAFVPEGVTSYTYNGKAQSLEIGYKAAYMRPIFSTVGVGMDLEEGKVTFTVTNVKEYVVGFVLLDSANTTWSNSNLPAGVTVDGDTVTFTWIIGMDESENDPENPIVSTKNDLYFTYGGVYDTNTIAVMSGYEGQITLFYAPRTEGSELNGDVEWIKYNINTDRLNAGSYWLKVVLSDLNGTNFTDKVTIDYFTVSPKEITATVSGEITYGDDLASTHFTPVVEGLLSNDKVTGDGYSYGYAEDYKLIVAGGEYYIVLKTDANGVVQGLSAGSNYVIKAKPGLLVINKRNINVTIDTLEGYYAVEPDTAWVTYQSDYLAPGEDLSVLGIKFTINATAQSVAGGEYWITIESYDNTNYIISSQRARYIVKTLEIEVSLSARENMSYKDGIDWCVRIDYDNITIPIDGEYNVDKDLIRNTLTLTLLYTGTSYGGVAYNSAEAPINAGIYKAQVVGSSTNYTLIGMPEIEFTINKQVLDNTLLSIANQTYTGELLTPVITVDGGEYDDSLFFVRDLPNSIDAGTYYVIVTIDDHDNYQWANPLTPTSVTLVFTVDKADDEETTKLTIAGWQYGLYSVSDNSPYAEVKSGGTVHYEYSIDGGKTYTSIVPDTGVVGIYYVRAVVAESTNYNAYVGQAVRFEITKHLLDAPTLSSNDNTYTSDELVANISVFDNRYMTISSDARTFLSDDGIVAVTVGAGTYYFYVGLLDTDNFAWSNGDGNAQGVITLEWTVAKKKIDLPTAGENSFIINHGNNIVYMPDGFDETLMTIEGNEYSYSGTFKAVIRLIDTDNYEWANGQDFVELEWYITGSESIFIAITVTLAVVTTAGISGIMVQLLLEKRRKRNEASAMRDIESKDASTDSVEGGKQ